MMTRREALAGLTAAGLAACTHGTALGQGPAGKARKKVLVEVFTSQGCDSCPPAADLMGQYAKFGYGTDKVIPLAFHVDYFDKPWKDVFSNPKWSERQAAYCTVLEKRELYYTPLLLVDGRHDALANAGLKVEEAIKKGLAEAPLAELVPTFDKDDNDPSKRALQVNYRALNGTLDGRELILGVAVFQYHVTTKVESGENRGKTLVEHNAVRTYDVTPVSLARRLKTATVPVEIRPEWKAENCGVAVLLQEEKTGRVYQAEELPWAGRRKR